MYYIRKVERIKWNGRPLYDSVSIGDLKTDDNDISVWADDDSQDECKRLALAFALTTSKISDLYCIRIPETELNAKKLNLVPQKSGTPYLPQQSKHVNIKAPTLYEIGDLAEIMYNEVCSAKVVYISEQELKELFYQAVQNDEIQMDFNDKKHKNFRKPLRDIELQKGAIDFTKLKNVKDITPDDKVTCPTCKGKGKITKDKWERITGKK